MRLTCRHLLHHRIQLPLLLVLVAYLPSGCQRGVLGHRREGRLVVWAVVASVFRCCFSWPLHHLFVGWVCASVEMRRGGAVRPYSYNSDVRLYTFASASMSHTSIKSLSPAARISSAFLPLGHVLTVDSVTLGGFLYCTFANQLLQFTLDGALILRLEHLGHIINGHGIVV